MLKKLGDWFKSTLDAQQDRSAEHTVELATAVLLYEIMRADDKFAEPERQVLEKALRKHFSLNPQEMEALQLASTQQAHRAADFVQFTRVINNACGVNQKRAILDSLWHIAFADDVLDPHEEHLIRRIADLLYIPHSQFIQSKLSAQGSRA